MPLPAFGRALAHRNYRLFMAGQGVSLIGTWMQQIAVSWLVWERTHSAYLLGVVSFCGQIPTFFLAPVAGALSDRTNRHRTLVIVQTAAMLQSIALIALTATGHLEIWHIVALSVVLGVVNAFDMPTRQAFLVDLAPSRDDLPNAIALNSSMVNGARLVGPLVAGLLIAAGGVMTCFVVNAISYLAVLAALAAMRDLPERPRRSHAPVLQGIAEGFAYAFGFGPIRAILLLLGLVSLTGMPISTLLPIFANDILHGGPKLFGALAGMSGVGALTAALYLASRNTVLGLGRVIAWATALFGLSIVLFAASRSPALSLVLAVATGFSMMLQLAACNTLLQTIVDDDKRGRVMSLYTMSFMGTAPLGSLLAGVMANAWGAPTATALGGVACIVGGVVFSRRLPKLREQVRPIYQRAGILPPMAVAVEAVAELTTAPEKPA